jgi:hypothetical protein
MTTVCVVLEQEITFAVTVTVPPTGTVDGDKLIKTPHNTCNVTLAVAFV